MSILVLNAGSSTLKYALFSEDSNKECGGVVDWKGDEQPTASWHDERMKETFTASVDVTGFDDAGTWIVQHLQRNVDLSGLRAVGHRIVHGGTEFRQPVLINKDILKSIETLSDLAPIHNPPALAVIETIQSHFPKLPQVAVFDTSFYSNFPPRAFLYPVPYEWYEKYGVRRFGFHGISHSYCALRAAELMNRPGDQELRLVSCHLGNGCSATAIVGKTPVMTTMGFTPLEGLMMGTRSGSIDPGILFHLAQRYEFTPAEIETELNRASGLLGVSGISSDLRTLEETVNERSRLAIQMFTDRIQSTIGALAVTMGGLDALVFTGGIGQHSAYVRSQSCIGLECLGVQLDEDANQSLTPDSDIASSNSSVRVLIIETQEEEMIAKETLQLINDAE